MPKFKIACMITNNSGVPVSAHVGASLVGVDDWKEFYNTSEDIKKDFPTGRTLVVRYLTTELGKVQKYNLYIALWEGEKAIGKGIKYAGVKVSKAVEKKKKIQKVYMTIGSTPNISPRSFYGI